MSLDDIDDRLKTFQFLVDNIPTWIASINTILDNTPQRIAGDHRDTRSSSRAITTPGLSAQEDTTVEFSSIEPVGAPACLHSFNTSYSHQQPYLPTPQQHAASHSNTGRHSLHKRKRSTSPAASERSSKQNKYRWYNSLRVNYDGDAQHSLEAIVKGTEKSVYVMKKSRDSASADSDVSSDDLRRIETILEALKRCTDDCYSAALQLLKDGTCDEQLKPVIAKFQVVKREAEIVISASTIPPVQPISTQTPLQKDILALKQTMDLSVPQLPKKPQERVEVEVEDDEEEEDDELVMSKIAHRLTSRMAKA